MTGAAPLTRRGVLKLAVVSALAAGPLSRLLKTPGARGAARRIGTQCSDCLERQDAADAKARKICAKHLTVAAYGIFSLGTPIGLAFAVGCFAGAVAGSWNAYNHCRTACGLPVTPPPPASPPPPPPPPSSGPCSTCNYYCGACPSPTDPDGRICCLYPDKDGKSPCCP